MFKSDNKIRIIFLCVLSFLLFGTLLFGGVEKAEAECCVTEPVDVNGIGGWFKEPNRIIDLVKYFKSTEGPWGKGKIDLGKIMNKAVTQDYFKKPEWDKVEQKDSLKSTLVKLWHNAVMKTEKESSAEALAWLKKTNLNKEKYAETSDVSTWTKKARKKESVKDFLIDLLEEAILDSVKKAPEDEKKFKYSWLEEWDKKQRNEASTKDFAIDLMEQAIQQASQTVRDPSKNAQYFQDKTGEEGKKEVKRELSKATLKEFLLYLKDSQEQFFYDFTQNMWGDNAEKIWEEYKTYELAKIEKAREDVGKLTYEVMKELKEEPTTIRQIKAHKDGVKATEKELDEYLRTMGLKISSSQDCSWGIKVDNAESEEGQCVVIKESGRAIKNTDDYVFGQSVKKARDAVMCSLPPWRHFSFGEGGGEVKKDWDIGVERGWCPQDSDDPSDYYHIGHLTQGASCNPEDEDTCKPKCSSDFICTIMTKEVDERPDIFSEDWPDYKKKLCPSDQQKEDLKKKLIFELARERDFLDTMPPEKWYYGERNMSSGHGSDYWSKGKNRCTLIMDTIPNAGDGRKEIESNMVNSLEGQRAMAFSKWEKARNRPPLLIQKGEEAGPGTDEPEYLANLSHPLTSPDGVRDKLTGRVNKIMNTFQSTQALNFQAGEGIAPKQYLIGWQADPDDKKRDDVYTINTGDIISPAKILTSKIEAAQQAQFDLAMKSWKKQPEGYEQTEWTCPEPSAGEIKEKKYNKLECGKEGDKKLERKWYKVELKEENQPVEEPPAEDPRLKYQCKYPVFNELTCRKFGDFETEVARYTNFEELPHELPAPSEDPGEYAKVPESYMDEAKKDTGQREPPPDFRRDKKGDDSAYEDGLWKKFPEIYGEEGEDGPYPRKKENVPKVLKEEWSKKRSSERYYLNKYYKDVTQLYEKPMSQVMCEWFVGEDMISKDDTKSTIFQDDSKLKNLIYDKCLPTTKDDYKNLKEPKEGKVPTEKSSSGSGGGCFVAGTKVKTKTGFKEIQTIEEGEKVLTKDLKQGNIEPQLVTKKASYKRGKMVELTAGKIQLVVSANHRFFVKGKGWLEAVNLEKADPLVTYKGELLEVEKVKRLSPEQQYKVYNLEKVAGNHTFFVGKEGVLVHNAKTRFAP